MQPVVFVVLDGGADSGKITPLGKAKKPNIEKLLAESLCGLWRGAVAPKDYNPKSMSDVATLELLGYSYKDNPGRGYLEALGIGMKADKNAIYLRGNFATAKRNSDGSVEILDRRAGRDDKGLDELAEKISMRIGDAVVECRHSVGHRCVIAVKGKGLGIDITDSDTKDGYSPTKGIRKKSEKTARILNEFSERSFEILSSDPINRKRKVPANFILLRGASKMKKVKSFKQKFGFRACAISGVGIIRGISKYLGIDFIEVDGATGHVKTNLRGKLKAAIKALKKYDFVFLHINGCDEAGHDKNFMLKKMFIEKVDKEVISKLSKINGITTVITSDHQTSVKSGSHVFGPVPFLMHVYGKDLSGFSGKVSEFSERECGRGYFSANLMSTLKKFGE